MDERGTPTYDFRLRPLYAFPSTALWLIEAIALRAFQVLFGERASSYGFRDRNRQVLGTGSREIIRATDVRTVGYSLGKQLAVLADWALFEYY